jgi:hypothetical protein
MVFLAAYDNLGRGSGWSNVGTWNVPLPGAPSVVGATPVSGTGLTQTFSIVVAHPAGVWALQYVYVLIGSQLDGANSYFIEFFRPAATIRLVNDAGTNWLAPQPVGGGSPQNNSQCTINPLTASISTAGGQLTLNIPVTFASGYTGVKNVFVSSFDFLGSGSDWKATGQWTVPAPGPPSVTGAPSNGAGPSSPFIAYVRSPGGEPFLGYVYVLIHNSLVASGSCFIEYNHINRTARLASDSGLTWPAPQAIGTLSIFHNSQCSFDVSKVSLFMFSRFVTLIFPVQFKPAYAGPKTVFIRAIDRGGLDSGWQAVGSWTAQ